MHHLLNTKLAAIRDGTGPKEFILADARDADMAWGIASPGQGWPAAKDAPQRSMQAFHQEIRDVVKQGIIDIMLASVSTMSLLAHEEHLFEGTNVTPAIRANDTSDVWCGRGMRYRESASRPFSTCYLEEAQHGIIGAAAGRPVVNLGLYSMTFNNDLEADRESLEAFRRFRADATRLNFRYFLEVFAPNIDAGIAPENIPGFVNDHIVRTLAGAARSAWPEFLKIPFFGPKALEELVNYDSSMVVGVLGGSSGTTFDAFKLIAEAQKHGARVALFGRKIKDAEDPLAFIAFLRRIVEGEVTPEEAVKAYHGELQGKKIAPRRPLDDDLQLTAAEMSYAR